MKNDVFKTQITKNIISMLERVNSEDWKIPWKNIPMPFNGNTKRFYSGINILILWYTAIEKEFVSPEWRTFNQWSNSGCKIKKGSKGTQIVFWKPFEVDKKDKSGNVMKNDDGSDAKKTLMLMRNYTVFNAEQVEGYECPLTANDIIDFKEIPDLEKFVKNTKAKIEVDGFRGACYIPLLDTIQMPQRKLFESEDKYYSTLFHELTHWTKKEHRCNRKRYDENSESISYAFEELVAELGSAFLCSKLGIESNDVVREDHIQYVKNWLTKAKSDENFVWEAAKHASKAFDYLYEAGKGKDK